MCGICGMVDARGASRERLEPMMRALRHRGPDDRDHMVNGAVALGHLRLSIIDLDGGRQPISNEDGSISIVFNGEIYNYRQLRTELLRRGHRFSTSSDTEVIVHLYEDYGIDCVRHLRGMFAFALWDEKRQRLFAARDRLGQKPFFYAEDAGRLSFASEIKSVLASDPSLAELDLEALDQYLTLRVIAPPLTMFRRIRKLPPAHTLTYDAAGLRVERYWDLNYAPRIEMPEEELLEDLEERLVECLRLHLVSDVPVGAFMSGGLDSTMLVALIMKHGLASDFQTFTMGLQYRNFDEAPFARLVAERYGTRHHEEPLRPSLLETLPRLVWHLDEPSDSLSVCQYLISRMARQHVKVVLGGEGGDELFGGYDRYYGNMYAGHLAKLPHVIRRHGIENVLRMLPEGRWYKSLSHQLRWLNELSFHEGGARYARSLSYFYFGGGRTADLYGPVMQRFAGGFDAEAPIREAFDRAVAVEPLDRMLYADSMIRLPDHPVMILDRMTMAHGLEARAPFMDHELAEFAARLPAHMKIRGRRTRYLQRRLAERLLPAELLSRPKQGFQSALPYMLASEFRSLFEKFLPDSHLVAEGIFSGSEIRGLLDQHLSGRADHGNRLWLVLNSEVWYRMFIRGVSAEDLTAELAADGTAATSLSVTAA